LNTTADVILFLRVIWKRLWLILLLCIVTLGGVYYWTVRIPPVYRTQVKLQITAAEPAEVALYSQFRTGGVLDEIAQAKNDLGTALRSGFVAYQTIAALKVPWTPLDLRNRMVIQNEADTLNIVNVIFEADSPELVENLANTHVANALKYYRDVRAKPSTASRQFISEELKRAESDWSEAQNSFLRFKLRYNLEDLERQIQAQQDTIRSLRLESERAGVEIEKANAAAAWYEAEAEQMGKLAGQAELAGAKATADIYQAQARAYLASAVASRANAAGQTAAKSRYDQLIAQRQAELTTLIGLTAEYTLLETAVRRCESMYNFLLNKETEARLKESQALNVGFIQVIEEPRAPDQPLPSRLGQMLVASAVISLIGGIVLAFVGEFLASLRQPTPISPVGRQEKAEEA